MADGSEINQWEWNETVKQSLLDLTAACRLLQEIVWELDARVRKLEGRLNGE